MAEAKRFVYVAKAADAASIVSSNDYRNSIIFVEDTGEIWTHGKKFSSISDLSAIDVSGDIATALAKLTYFKTVKGNTGSGDAQGPDQVLNIKGSGDITTEVTKDGVVIKYTGADSDTVTVITSSDSITATDTGSGTNHNYQLTTDGSKVTLGANVSAASADGSLTTTDSINDAFAKVLKKINDVAAAAGAIEVPVTSVAAASGEKAILVTPEKGDVKVSLKTDNSGNVKFERTDAGLKGSVDLKDYALTSSLTPYENKIESVVKGSNAIDVTTSDKAASVSLVIAEQQGSNVTVSQANGLKVEVDLSNYWNKTEMPKDLVVKSGALSADGKKLILTLSNDTTVEIDVEKLIDVYKDGDGLTHDEKDPHTFKVKIDSESEDFLTVGASGVKLDGVQDAIDEVLETVQGYTVNGEEFGEEGEITLAGSDIELTGYTKGSDTSAVAAGDSVNEAIAKLENRIVAAASGGVQSFGGESGSITVKSGSTTSGEVNFAMSGKQLTGTVYGVATAAQGAKADTAIQKVSVSNGTYVTGTVTGTTEVNIAINDSAITELFAWEER